MRCPHAEGPEELPQTDGTHLLVAMGEASIPLLHLPPSCTADFVSGTLFAKHFLPLSCISPNIYGDPYLPEQETNARQGGSPA